MVTAGYALSCGEVCKTENVYAMFPGIDKTKKVPLGTVVFFSEELDVVVVSFDSELPSGAAPIVQVRRSLIETIDSGPSTDALKGCQSGDHTCTEAWLKHTNFVKPGAVGPLAVIGVDQDGFFLAFSRLLKTSYSKLVFSEVGGGGSGGAPVFDANTGELLCLVHSTDDSLGVIAVNCVTLASIIEASSSQPPRH
jgi:hypothetical protein